MNDKCCCSLMSEEQTAEEVPLESSRPRLDPVSPDEECGLPEAVSLQCPPLISNLQATEKLMQSTLQLGKTYDKEKELLKTTFLGRLDRTNPQLNSIRITLKTLQERCNELLAKTTFTKKSISDFEVKQEKEFEEVNSKIRDNVEDIVKMEGSIARFRDIFVIKNDPAREFALPPATFILDNFNQRKVNNEVWRSPPFYSHECGYKMNLVVYPNGVRNARDTHVSAFVEIVLGEFDDILQWPFYGTVYFHVENQLSDRCRTRVPCVVCFTTIESLQYREQPKLGRANPHLGCENFIRHVDLEPEDNKYLKNDCLIFCVRTINIYNLHH